MDPIEKLLSELAPAPGSRGLDRAMDDIFRRADRRKQWRRIGVIASGMSIALLVGLAAGFFLRRDSTPVTDSSSITYIVPMDTETFHALVESSTRRPVFPVQAAVELTHDDGA